LNAQLGVETTPFEKPVFGYSDFETTKKLFQYREKYEFTGLLIIKSSKFIARVGEEVGVKVGSEVGEYVGLRVGLLVGAVLGWLDGSEVG